MYYLYIIQSLDRLHFYIGSSSDVESRLVKHNQGASKSTRPFRPWEVIYLEAYSSKSEAVRREYFLKSPRGYLEKKALIGYHQR